MCYNPRERGDYMELQVETKVLLDHLHHVNEDWSEKDYLLIVSLLGIMERLERLQGAILSLQRTT
tara:strand:+ start:60 stop:254 length:195 start_codon:yes stop_codon:yes gene_type:complete